jgi:type IV pilus assembly protein PilQ
MKSFTRIALLIIVAATIVACAAAKENTKQDLTPQDTGNQLTAIEVKPEGVSTYVTLKGTDKPVYSIFRMSDPQRIIVDMANTSLGDVSPLVKVNDGLMTVITSNQYSEAGKPVTRVMLVFAREAEFVVAEADNSVIIKLAHPIGYVVPGAAAEQPTVVAQVESTEPPEVETSPVAEATPALVPMDVIACVGTEPIVLKAYDGQTSNVKLTGVTLEEAEGGVTVKLSTSAALNDSSIAVMRLCEPERMVIDLYGVSKGFKGKDLAGDGVFVERIRLGSHADKLRLVLDMARPLAQFDLNLDKNQTLLAFGQTQVAAPVAVAAAPAPVKEEPVVEPPTVDPAPVKTESVAVAQTETNDGRTTIEGIDFEHRPSSSTIAIKLSGAADYRLQQTSDDQYTLELSHSNLPTALEQTLDATEFNGPITLISSYVADPDAGLVKVAVQLRQQTTNRVTLEDGVLKWTFDKPVTADIAGTPSGHIQLAANGQTVIEYEPGEMAAAGMSASAATEATAAATAAGEGQGQRISLELKDTEILDVLRLIADVSKLNIIATDDVKGRITVRLLNVPWQQALDIILRAKGLGQERRGNIIRVAPLSVLQEEQEVRMRQAEARFILEPLEVRLIPVSYSSASAMVEKIKDLLSPRGTVNFDDRTNVIIVKDIAEVLVKAEALIAKLDLQTPQVMIEAKIVEADVNNEYGFGIQWGGYYIASEATGNPTGLNFPSSLGVAGAQDYASSPGLPNADQPPNWVVNLPTTNTPAGGMGFTFGNVTNTANLTIRLTALESAGKIKIVSSPRISTLDNKEATIEQGLQIPILSVTVTGVPVSKMVSAKLQLKVTPHITADGSIIMKLEITKQEPDFSRSNSLGDPAIINKEAKTEVLVRTGETTVIGGIYTKKSTWRENRVPLFGRIPVLGWLFKNRSVSEDKSELLIFVTPRIINRSQSSLVVD